MFGVVEGDESLSGARRRKGKRGRGAVGKTTVSGLFEREGQVYAEVVPGCKKATLQGGIGGKVDPAWVLTCDGWRGDNGLVDPGYGHYRVDRSRDAFARGGVHIKGLEGFWGVAKGGLSKVKGVPDHTVHLPLEETEWRDNNRHSNRYKLRLTDLRQNPFSQA